jgi:hypothetical protein
MPAKSCSRGVETLLKNLIREQSRKAHGNQATLMPVETALPDVDVKPITGTSRE